MFIRTVKLKDFPWNGWLRLGIEARLDAMLARQARDDAREREAEIGMEQAITGDGKRMAQHRFQEQVAAVSGHEPVAVREEKPATLEGDLDGIAVHAAADLRAEIGIGPEVVISPHECDRDAGLGESAEGGQHAEVAPWHGVPVFEPEVEQVPEQEQGGSEGRLRLEKRDHAVLTSAIVVLGARSEMAVGHEQGSFGGGHAREPNTISTAFRAGWAHP